MIENERTLIYTFEAAHSVASFRAFLQSLKPRGLLEMWASKYDVTVISKIHTDEPRRLIWAITTTPNAIMRIRETSLGFKRKASDCAELNEIISELLDQEYNREVNRLNAEFRGKKGMASPEYVEQRHQLDLVYNKRLEKATQVNKRMYERLWRAYLYLFGKFQRAKKDQMRSIWIEAYDHSPGSDQLTVDIVSYSGLVEFINDRDTALFQIVQFILGESVVSGSTKQQSTTELIPEDCSRAYNMSEYPLTEHIMPGIEKDFRECWSKWGDDRKENFETMLNLIKKGHTLVTIGQKLNVSESTISKRLNDPGRCSPRLTMEEVRSLLSSY